LVKEAASPEPAEKAEPLTPLESRVKAPFNYTQVASLLEASLSLAENGKHLPAIRILLSQALQLLQGQASEAANTG